MFSRSARQGVVVAVFITVTLTIGAPSLFGVDLVWARAYRIPNVLGNYPWGVYNLTSGLPRTVTITFSLPATVWGGRTHSRTLTHRKPRRDAAT